MGSFAWYKNASTWIKWLFIVDTSVRLKGSALIMLMSYTCMAIVLEMTILLHYIENVWYVICSLLAALTIHSTMQRHQRIQICKTTRFIPECTFGVMFIADLHSPDHLDSNLFINCCVSRLASFKIFFQQITPPYCEGSKNYRSIS